MKQHHIVKNNPQSVFFPSSSVILDALDHRAYSRKHYDFIHCGEKSTEFGTLLRYFAGTSTLSFYKYSKTCL